MPLAMTVAVSAALTMALPLAAQQADGQWQADVEVKKTAPAKPQAKPGPDGTTVIRRNGAPKPADAPAANANAKPAPADAAAAAANGAAGGTQVTLIALLTTDGQQIDQGLVWRIFQTPVGATGKSKLVAEKRDAAPALKLQPGDYTVNAAFGRASMTRKLSVKSGAPLTETFVINAGGLRVLPTIGGKPAPAGTVSIAIYADDRDQFANRTPLMTGAKPGLIVRLNAGIYHIVTTVGDANASVAADVTVEAGKLTEAAVQLSAAKANFKLVTRAGGEALPDTHWTILKGDATVKETVGALPAHTLAPGEYTVIAKSAGRMFKRPFTLASGDVANIEVLMQENEVVGDGAELAPSLEIKSP